MDEHYMLLQKCIDDGLASDIELRYKGSFTAYPQFFAGITPQFKKLLKDGKF